MCESYIVYQAKRYDVKGKQYLKTLERKIRPLQKIQNNYPKCIMTLDIDPVADYDGIKKFNVLDYLMHKIDFR